MTTTVEAPAATRTWLPLAAVGVTLLLWASAFVGIRHLGHTFSPGALTLGRLVIGSLALGVGLLLRGWVAPTRAQWLRLTAIGVLWFGIYNVALNAGERRVDAGTAAMLIQLSPILVALLSVVFLDERLHRLLVGGIVIAFTGVAVIALSTSPGGHRDLLGVGLCLLSAVVYAISLVLQKPLMVRLPAIQVTWVACTVGVVCTLPWIGTFVGQASDAGASDLAWLVYLGVFPTAIAFTTYAFALRTMTSSNLAVTTYLVPPLTVLMSWVLLSEVPPVIAYVGGALCLIGVAVARRRPRPRVSTVSP